MDLLSFLGVLGRHKIVTTVMVLMTAGALAAFIVTTPRVYEANATLVLLNPPPPPTRSEIRQNPALAKIHAANPYARFGDLSIIVDLVAQSVNAPDTKDRFASEGFTGTYSAARSYTASGPIVELSAQGPSEARAIAFARRLEAEFRAQLARPQTERRVDTNYQVRADIVVPPDRAGPVLTSLVRSVVSILALCAFATLAVAFLADAFRMARARRRVRRDGDATVSRTGSR